MSRFTRFATAAATIGALSAMLPAAAFAQTTEFAADEFSDFTWSSTASGGLFQFANTSTTIDLGDYLGQGLGSYKVNETITGGTKGQAATTAMTLVSSSDVNGVTTDLYNFKFLSPMSLAYTLATPMTIDGQKVSNLLTINLFGGTVFNVRVQTNDASGAQQVTGSWAFDPKSFSSDLLRFVNEQLEAGTFSFSSGTSTLTGTSAIAGTFSVQGNGNFSSNPLPQVPEVPSAALLVVGMAAVGVASRRRARRA